MFFGSRYPVKYINHRFPQIIILQSSPRGKTEGQGLSMKTCTNHQFLFILQRGWQTVDLQMLLARQGAKQNFILTLRMSMLGLRFISKFCFPAKIKRSEGTTGFGRQLFILSSLLRSYRGEESRKKSVRRITLFPHFFRFAARDQKVKRSTTTTPAPSRESTGEYKKSPREKWKVVRSREPGSKRSQKGS